MSPRKNRTALAAEQSGLVEATTNLILLATVVLIGSLIATTVVGVSLKYMDFGHDGLGEFSETGVRSPGLFAFGFQVDVANSSFGGEDSADVILAAQGPTEIWEVAARDWGDGSPEGLPPDYFAVLLTGYLWCPTQSNVSLQLNAEGQAWVWVDNQQSLSTLSPTATLSLSAGYHPLKVKYVATGNGADACLELLWDISGQMATFGQGEIFH